MFVLFFGFSCNFSADGVSNGFSSCEAFPPFSASDIDEVEESLLVSDPDDVSPVLESLPYDCFSCRSSASPPSSPVCNTVAKNTLSNHAKHINCHAK